MSANTARESETRLGQGRSGVVFKVLHTPADGGIGKGDHLAVKVFTGEPLAKLVLYLLTGAPNPYMWNEDAIEGAVLRRRILADLVEHWFGDKLSVANAVTSRWNPEHRAFGLATEFSPGRTASLHHPFSADRDDELHELTHTVMQPLQGHLIACGFDGLVWQAGMGNPVATNNFLLDEDASAPTADGGSGRRWTWIDLESGVPALFPLNPLPLFTFYLPKSVAHRRPLFDDVDIPKFQRWLDTHATALEESVGVERFAVPRDRATELGERQERWRRQRRVGLWYGRLVAGAPAKLARSAWRGIERVAKRILRGRQKPWIALLVGLLPVVGNAAYPLQIIQSGSSRDAKLAQFIIYNTLTRLGAMTPIWGGPDTQIEHLFNRIGDLLVRDRRPD